MADAAAFKSRLNLRKPGEREPFQASQSSFLLESESGPIEDMYQMG